MIELISYILIVMGISAHFFYWPLVGSEFSKKHPTIFSMVQINWIFPVLTGSILLLLF